MKYSGQSTITRIFQLVKLKFEELSSVAKSGSYSDLINKPNIPNLTRADIIISNVSNLITIPINVSDVSKLLVYHNGILLTLNTHYSVSGSSITLIDYTTSIGDIISLIYIG